MIIDVEASSLAKGYPIEVGWAVPSGAGEILSQSILIDPCDTSWMSNCVWDARAEQLHGITLAYLQEHGLGPHHAVEVINTVLQNEVLYSDSPELDTRWVDMLHAEARTARRFDIAAKAASALIVELADIRRTGDLDYTAAELEARQRAGDRHRAGPDAAYWAHLWLLIDTGFRAPTGVRPAFGPLRRKP